MIHCQNVIIMVQVAGFQLTGASDDGNVSPAHGLLHAAVRRLAHMKARGAGGFDFELVGESGLIHQMLEDTMSRRGAADVAHAKKEDACHENAFRIQDFGEEGRRRRRRGRFARGNWWLVR